MVIFDWVVVHVEDNTTTIIPVFNLSFGYRIVSSLKAEQNKVFDLEPTTLSIWGPFFLVRQEAGFIVRVKSLCSWMVFLGQYLNLKISRDNTNRTGLSD